MREPVELADVDRREHATAVLLELVIGALDAGARGRLAATLDRLRDDPEAMDDLDEGVRGLVIAALSEALDR